MWQALRVAGVAQSHIHKRFAWQAWHNLTSTIVLCGRRGTHGTGWRAWVWLRRALVARDAAALCVAGVAQSHIDLPTCFLHVYHPACVFFPFLSACLMFLHRHVLALRSLRHVLVSDMFAACLSSGMCFLSVSNGMFDVLACLHTFFCRLVSFPFTFAARYLSSSLWSLRQAGPCNMFIYLRPRYAVCSCMFAEDCVTTTRIALARISCTPFTSAAEVPIQ